jgi:uncharacterized protein YceH (UPF0502 family)
MYGFSDLEEVELVLQKLIDRQDGALARKLPHAPGTKEARYAHNMGALAEEPAVAAASPASDRLSALEAEVEKLRNEVAELTRRLDAVL